ncbi:hypothetical protein P168DRAFT_327036 [Aspergillus campestris IBT 28561]|uniref:WW domain-containing protein n=1 Tax=Aspergillus campestris (strain IBT 28561) TaxID=1392248 RepID=A0A2I1D2B5_ASPC2|nr:uncharacterized protein P168DRAFT_327036 [Aspergillus campestris IBT 28561]PKY04015.1 hypothetical protein P168DRAFT_327036 [Aspergillus campestris IBT 28561]
MNPNHHPEQGELFLSDPGQSQAESPIVGPLRISKNHSPPPASHNSPLPYPDDRPRYAPLHGLESTGSPGAYQGDSPTVPGPGASKPWEYPTAFRSREGREPKPVTLAERRATCPSLSPSHLPGTCRTGKRCLRESISAFQRRRPRPATLRLRDLHIRITRGSPPPPETPIVEPGQQPASDIEARYAASGIAGTSTLTGLQAQSAAAQRRAEQYAGQQPRNQQLVQRPWTPTEQPGSQPHGPPTVYQGDGVVSSGDPPASPFPPPQSTGTPFPPPQSTGTPFHPPQSTGSHPPQSTGSPFHPPQSTGTTVQQAQAQTPSRVLPNALEQDLDRMRISSSPPPAYSSVSGPNVPQGYPNEKQRMPAQQPQPVPDAVHPAMMGPMSAGNMAPVPVTSAQDHPAFANDPRQQHPMGHSSQGHSPQGHSPQDAVPNGAQDIQPQQVIQQTQIAALASPTGLPPASPPPLPEGWIAHLDPNSGQYYYIHLPSQSTQWEFPKGPTPLNLNETPLSPVGSIYSSHPLTSPGLSAFGKPLASPGLPMTPGFESLQSPVVAPTNGVYFGPYLRYANMDVERGKWLGSILLVTDAPQPPTIHTHQSADLSPNPRQLKPLAIAVHQRWTFYKYELDIQMDEAGPAKWTYAITSHLGCTRYEFLVAGRYETNWRFVTTSGNDFSLNINANERSRVGGEGFMWKDIMQKHTEIGGFHAQLCLGGQIYADRMWKEIASLRQWLTISGKEARKTSPWSAALEEDVSRAYFHYYTSHFDQPYLRESFAQIPYICQIDDHDIFDGFGSYPEHMQFSNMFKNIGRVGIEMYLLFQHHTSLEILRNVSTDTDLFTITGTGWHFVKFLGPAVVVVGVDCRSERNPHQVVAGPTYQGIFPKIAMLPPSVQHCLWMISVPVIYPRLETAEHIAHTVTSGKRAITGAYNVLGKVTSSVAGVVGAKDMVGSGFDSVKRAVGKSGLMGGILSPFGEFDMMDELRDQWTHESKDLERTYLIRTLQGIAHQKSLRMTFLSGAVNVCGAGLVHDPSHPSDHKTMYQLISSAVVNSPPPSYILKLLHNNNKPIYIPANGHRSTPSQPTDTKEDMMEIFQSDVTGQAREHRKLMGRRNYVAIVAYDPETVNNGYGPAFPGHGGKLNLAADFMVQGEGAYGSVVKYGPVIVPSLELGK